MRQFRPFRFISDVEFAALMSGEVMRPQKSWAGEQSTLGNKGVIYFFDLFQARNCAMAYDWEDDLQEERVIIEFYSFLTYGEIELPDYAIVLRDTADAIVGQGKYLNPCDQQQDDEEEGGEVLILEELGLKCYSKRDIVSVYKRKPQGIIDHGLSFQKI